MQQTTDIVLMSEAGVFFDFELYPAKPAQPGLAYLSLTGKPGHVG
jgi:hypothetical protein